jgi:hypothetical protein
VTVEFSLEHPLFQGHTGRGVRVAVIDSGIHAGNPHISTNVSGINLTGETEDDDFVDRLGHGTAVSAAILDKAPAVDLFAIRVFDRTLATSAALLARAIECAAEHDCRLINLSLGTSNPERADLLEQAVQQAIAYGAVVISARELNGTRWFPGSLQGVIGVLVDPDCPRHALRIDRRSEQPVLRASGFPRPIPGVPPERNLQGISFAVANVTGMIARLVEGRPALRSSDDVFDLIREG